VYPAGLFPEGGLAMAAGRDCAKNSTIYIYIYIYTSAFSSKEAFVIRNPLLCEFPKLNPFIMATARGGREKQNEQKRKPSWPSQMNI
jgi:hypothetical protein